MDLNTPFSKRISDPARAAIATAIWGEEEKAEERIQRLMLFFEFYRRETMSTAALSVSKAGCQEPIPTRAELIVFISLLKKNPEKGREELKSILSSTASQNSSLVTIDVDTAIDLTVRLMFMTACRSQNIQNIVATMQIFRPKWKEPESLGQFIERIFPRCEPPDQGSRNATIRSHKFTAHYVKQYLNIQIQWMDHLSDHLVLQKGDTWKSIYIFCHPSMLEIASKTLGEYNLDTFTNTALSL